MRIAMAQINSVLGDFKNNRLKMQEYVQRAVEKHCDLVVFPECSLMGYHPVDLLERPSVVKTQLKELSVLSKSLPKGVAVLVGAITLNKNKKGKPYRNSAVLLIKGKAPQLFHKQLLPTYDVFDEGRHIEPGETKNNIFKFKGQRILVTICEDIWAWPKALTKGRASLYSENPLAKMSPKSVDLIVNLSASPFTLQKMKLRQYVCTQTVKHFKAPMIYINMVGGQDELIFDGGSMAFDEKAKLRGQCLRFEEDLNVFDITKKIAGPRQVTRDSIDILRQALVLGIRDFVTKTGLNKVHFGLSGGIDSALVACLAVEALGPNNVKAVALPGPFNADESLKLAEKLAKNLGIEFLKMDIGEIYKTSLKTFSSAVKHDEFNLVDENLQARIRGLLLMALANKENSLLLATTNKSEMAMGYGTLYGDLGGGLMPLGDLVKGEIYAMSEFYNQNEELIPSRIITRPPSAELRPGQKDSDSLPPYNVLDKAVEKLVEGFREPTGEVEKRVLNAMMKSEFKRWQAAPILKVSDHAFGRGRRFPVAHKAFY